MADKDYILSFAHCKRCLAELPEGQSPRGNVLHIDFEGHKHPLIAGTDPAEN
jgi:hypothetical protein